MMIFARLICVAIALALGMGAALGQVPNGGSPLVPSAAPATPTGPLSFTPPSVINVVDYGAKCDNATDDSTAINAAISAARTLAGSIGAFSQTAVALVFPGTKVCLFQSTLNLTGFSMLGVHIYGGTIRCQTNGTPCIDGLGSRYVSIHFLDLIGDSTREASYGIQIGRITSSGADGWLFDNVTIRGFFTSCAYYNFASEVVTRKRPFIQNLDTGSGAYADCLDGVNHFNITSAFVTQTLPQNSASGISFNDHLTEGGYIQGSGSVAAVFLAGTGRPRYLQSYSSSGGSYNVEMYFIANDSFLNQAQAIFDVHFEGGGITDNFFLTGNISGAVTIRGLRWATEHTETASNSVFKIDGGSSITSVVVWDLDLQMSYMTAPKVWDAPLAWTVNAAHISVPAQTNWNEPNVTSGTVCIAGTCTTYVPTPAVNRNPDFIIDNVNEGGSFTVGGGGQLITDGWLNQQAGGVFGNLTYQNISGCNIGASQACELVTITTPTNFSSTQRQSMQTMIEGPQAAELGFGMAGSGNLYLSVDFCLYANNTGKYDAYLQGIGGARSYIIEVNVTVANVEQCFHNVVPVDTGSPASYLVKWNQPGLLIGFSWGCGSTFQTSAGAWQAGTFYCTSGALNFANTSSATLRVMNVHVRSTQFNMPYKPRLVNQEIEFAQRFYNKSFESGVKGAQNLSSNLQGAVTFSSPYAQITNTTVDGPQIRFPTAMYNNVNATPPAITFYSTNAASANCYNVTQARDSGAAAAINVSDKGFSLQCTLVAGDLLGDVLRTQWQASVAF